MSAPLPNTNPTIAPMSNSEPSRVSYIDLANKICIACFVRSDVPQATVEIFEESFAVGRSHWTDWVACPTRSHQESAYALFISFELRILIVIALTESINDLLDLCIPRFSSLDNSFYPYFSIILDERTSRDESVLPVQRDPCILGHGTFV